MHEPLTQEDIRQKLIEHGLLISQQGDKIDELQNNVTDLRELIQQMDKLVVRFDVTIKLMEKIMWGGVGGILIYFLNQLLRFI
jgi:wobble nucleotide-excising tRNase